MTRVIDWWIVSRAYCLLSQQRRYSAKLEPTYRATRRLINACRYRRMMDRRLGVTQ